MTPDNDNQQPGGGERPVPPAGPRREQTRPIAPGSLASGSVGLHRETSRWAAEERILREGEAARLALARRTAREALADPAILDAKRLGRLGPDGLARFIAELRHGALGTTGQADVPASTTGDSARPSPPGGAGGASTPRVLPNAAPSAAGRRRASDQSARTGSSGARAPARGSTPTRPPTVPTPRTASFAGWWRSQKEGRPSFEARARRWGGLAGLLLIVAGLVLLAMVHR